MVCSLQNLGEGFDDGNVNAEDCSKFTNLENLKNWKDEELIQSIRDRFVTGDWQKAKSRNKVPGSNSEEEDDDDAVYGDFEDLEAENNRHQTNDIGNGAIQKENDSAAEERRLKKLALRAKFDAQYPFNLIHFILFSPKSKSQSKGHNNFYFLFFIFKFLMWHRR